MVLGPILESRYLQTYTISDGQIISYIFSRPLSIVLVIITIIFLISPLFFKNVGTGEGKKSSEVDEITLD
jgi:TctA family transporter